MKNQKNLIALALSVMLFSCSNNEPIGTGSTTAATGLTYEVVGTTALPSSVSTYIASNYVGATTTEVNLVSDGTYVVYVAKASGTTAKLTSSAVNTVVTKLIFSIRGALISAKVQSVVAIADLLPAITTYITTNYVGAVINNAHVESDGSFEVHIVTSDGLKLELKFDSAGTFVSLSSNNNNHFSSNEAQVAIVNLLANIKTYITTNYAGATIKEAHVESDGTYDVVITTAAVVNVKLNFSAAGVFLKIKS